MSSNSSSPKRLDIWRPCRWQQESLNTNYPGAAEVASSQECLYSWEPVGGFFGSVRSKGDAQRLSNVLTKAFSSERPHNERGIEHLRDAIQVLDEILSKSDDSSWSDSEELRRLPSGEDINLRQHQLLALRQHMQWIYDTFGSVPRANVILH